MHGKPSEPWLTLGSSRPLPKDEAAPVPRATFGSLPLPEDEMPPPPDPRIAAARQAGQTLTAKWLEKTTAPQPAPLVLAVTALQRARTEAAKAAGWVQDTYFNDWARRNVERAEMPAEWTKARTLYENYLANAPFYGQDGDEQKEVVQALATETQWGRMMATLPVAKVRRGSGMYYALKCKPRDKKPRRKRGG